MTQSTQETASFSLVIDRTVNAPRERVFEAFTQPDHLSRWWAAREGYSTPIAEVDLRVGGSYRLGMQDPEQEHPFVVGGVFREVTPPEKLVFTWIWETAPHDSDWTPPETLVTVEFTDLGDSTGIRLTHQGLSDENMRDEHTRGWGGCLDSLTKYLAIAVGSAGLFVDLSARLA